MPRTRPAQASPVPSRSTRPPDGPPPPRPTPPNPGTHQAAAHGHRRDAHRHVPTAPRRRTSYTGDPRPHPRAPEPFDTYSRHHPTPHAAPATVRRPLGRPPTAPQQTAERACRRPTRPGSLCRSPHAPRPLPVVAPRPIPTPPPSSRPAPTHRRHGSPTQRHTPAEGQDGPAPPRTALLTVAVPQRHCNGPWRRGTSGSDRRRPGWTVPPTGGSQHPTAQPRSARRRPAGPAPARWACTTRTTL